MGLTFAVAEGTDSIVVNIGGGIYRLIDSGGEHEKPRYQRVKLGLEPLTVVCAQPQSGYIGTGVLGLDLYVRVRPNSADGIRAVTLVLVNKLESVYEERDIHSFFQTRLTVSADDSPFVERPPSQKHEVRDEDIGSYRLLYRNAREFAIGHGCSVEWNSETDSGRTSSIWTTFAPQRQVPIAESNPSIDSKALSLKFLVESKPDAVCSALDDLADSYDKWISDRQNQGLTLPTDLADTARKHLVSCNKALDRIRGGIGLLRSGGMAYEAFRLMNVAMFKQRARSEWLKKNKPTQKPGESAELGWRPFQLAFILLCLRGIVDPTKYAEERASTDLLWFPTGGGKTEAYLGLIAFVTFYRRLTNTNGGGVTAIMRYTLRLLTIQQFERAALMICCCEHIRQTDTRLGQEQVSIGMWVGKGATPNKVAAARIALDKLRKGSIVLKENPVQLHACPWCGTRLNARNYWITAKQDRMIVSCRNDDCEFKSQLPVYLIDEEVYRSRPTLLIATVDKFAALPWNEETGSLFNLDAIGPQLQRKPELIIQDELHLISGPLGTLTGLYETAIDALCAQNGIGPKVIASTATIRRAGEQGRALFNRPVLQFPPPGVDAGDSYFAIEAPPDQKGDRLYLGLMAPATSPTTLMIRTYAALLQRAAELEKSSDIVDPYWTLIGYFNSLRVLGGAVLQVQDDVRDRVRLLAKRHQKQERRLETVLELTSRLGSMEVPERLSQMARTKDNPQAADVILATNMISVGVDIDRLGLMVVMGQPQSTSEYIQATSRVGRRHPGLVVTLLNANRSRDRSHYESFVSYHSALYRQVESTSVTPFSARARDRGLHAVIISLARQLLRDFRPNTGAKAILNHRDELTAIKNIILKRVQDVCKEEAESAEQHIEYILDRWSHMAESPLTYWGDYPLLRDAASTGSDEEEGFPTLWSLRDVDAESELYMLRPSWPGKP